MLCAVCFYLRVAAPWARYRDRRSLCFSPSAGSVLAFSAVLLWVFSLVCFPLFGVLGLCGSSFPLIFVCRETQDVDFFPLLFVEVVLQLLWSPIEFVVDHNWFC